MAMPRRIQAVDDVEAPSARGGQSVAVTSEQKSNAASARVAQMPRDLEHAASTGTTIVQSPDPVADVRHAARDRAPAAT